MPSAPIEDNILGDVPNAPALSYFWHRKRQLGLRLLRRHCEFSGASATPRPMVLADLGCGWGTDLYFFLQALHQFTMTGAAAHDWRLIGIDGDVESLALARQRLTGATGKVELIESDFTAHIPLPDHSVDVIYCSEVLEHMLDPMPFVAEWRRVLRAGGSVLVTTPNEPNVLQRSFYSRRRREANRVRLLESPRVITGPDGRIFRAYGHVGIRRIDEWEALFFSEGLRLIDFERGAVVYGSGFHNHSAIFALQRAAEGALDLLPKRWTRFASDQLIGLYRFS